MDWPDCQADRGAINVSGPRFLSGAGSKMGVDRLFKSFLARNGRVNPHGA
jgi:hypothetical protein